MSRLHTLLAVAATVCGAAHANPRPNPPAKTADAPPASMQPKSGAEAAEVAKLRAEGPTALARLLGTWDAMKPGTRRDALADRIDRVAAQRYATSSRMFWHTDLETAKAEAQKQRKPILSLRMLGRLDEDMSCANSRYFRIALYANTELSQWLRDHFILHWSSERAVPRVTIDFGDGRMMERTITGNSVHYVLDPEGHPVDALPGLYAAAVFKTELEKSLQMIATLREKPADQRASWLSELHRLALVERYDAWKKIARVRVPAGERFRPEAFPQLATITKAGTEWPTYRVVDLGVDVGQLPEDAQVWAQLGMHLMPAAPPPKPGDNMPPGKLTGGGTLRLRGEFIGTQGEGVVIDAQPPIRIGDVLDPNSKALLTRLIPMSWTDKATPADAGVLTALINRFERDILADTALNEFAVRLQIRGIFINHRAPSFESLNEAIYRQVFHTPKSDVWLGLAPAGVTALPHDGLVVKRSR